VSVVAVSVGGVALSVVAGEADSAGPGDVPADGVGLEGVTGVSVVAVPEGAAPDAVVG
jgi:hypothetical protein